MDIESVYKKYNRPAGVERLFKLAKDEGLQSTRKDIKTFLDSKSGVQQLKETKTNVKSRMGHIVSFNPFNLLQQNSFNENSSKADNLRRGLDTAPTQGSASAGIHIYIVTDTYTHIHIVCTHAHTGQFSLTSIPSQTNTTFSSVLVSQFHLVNVHPTSTQPITNSHYLFHPRTTPDHY
jgi:hypothetical protein